MGRCIYVDENDQPTGLEHPSASVSLDRVLEYVSRLRRVSP